MAKITITWTNMGTGATAVEEDPENAPLRALVQNVCGRENWSPGNPDEWNVKDSPRGDPLDKEKSPSDYGWDGAVSLFLQEVAT
ncbi:MAG: hypothetical protein ACYTKD_05810 [Planctomycetota bacterium]|jgi:hypothetical protein